MVKAALSLPRKALRVFLYFILIGSFLFAGSIIYLRLNPHHVHNNQDIREIIFKADIIQHKTFAMFGNDEQKLQTARYLINNAFYSPRYWQEGMAYLQNMSDNGYAPAQTLYADILLSHTFTDIYKTEAERYYTLAAEQNHRPARIKLSNLQNANSR